VLNIGCHGLSRPSPPECGVTGADFDDEGIHENIARPREGRKGAEALPFLRDDGEYRPKTVLQHRVSAEAPAATGYAMRPSPGAEHAVCNLLLFRSADRDGPPALRTEGDPQLFLPADPGRESGRRLQQDGGHPWRILVGGTASHQETVFCHAPCPQPGRPEPCAAAGRQTADPAYTGRPAIFPGLSPSGKIEP